MSTNESCTADKTLNWEGASSYAEALAEAARSAAEGVDVEIALAAVCKKFDAAPLDSLELADLMDAPQVLSRLSTTGEGFADRSLLAAADALDLLSVLGMN